MSKNYYFGSRGEVVLPRSSWGTSEDPVYQSATRLADGKPEKAGLVYEQLQWAITSLAENDAPGKPTEQFLGEADRIVRYAGERIEEILQS